MSRSHQGLSLCTSLDQIRDHVIQRRNGAVKSYPMIRCTIEQWLCHLRKDMKDLKRMCGLSKLSGLKRRLSHRIRRYKISLSATGTIDIASQLVSHNQRERHTLIGSASPSDISECISGPPTCIYSALSSPI